MSESLDSLPLWATTFFFGVKVNTLDEQNLDQTCPLDIGRHRLEPIFDLGRLERLPYELIAEILAQLDLRSLFDFRRVNQRAMQAVDGVPQFKQILKHHLTVIRAALAIQVGSNFSCVDLHCTLRNPSCEHCGDFAGYIYLLACSRVCFLCFTEMTRYLPLTAAQVYRNFGVNKSHLPGLPSVKSLAGHYSTNDERCPKRLVLYDHDSAHQAGIALRGSQAAMMQFASNTFSRKMDKYENRKDEYVNGSRRLTPRRPISASEEHDGCSSNPHRFMAVVRATWIASAADAPVRGFYCGACRLDSRNQRRKFTEETFKEHIRQFGSISIRDGKHNP